MRVKVVITIIVKLTEKKVKKKCKPPIAAGDFAA
jgi:hypothetical protein